MKITVGSARYELKKLSRLEMLVCINKARETFKQIDGGKNSIELASALAEYGALAAACLYKGNTPAFSSPKEALSCLSVDELCVVYDRYNKMNCGEK